MSFNPTPYVTVDGTEIQPGLSGPADYAAVVISDLSISYGRSNLLEQPSPGTARVKLLVKPRYAALAKDPFNRKLTVGIRYPGEPGRVIFRGKINNSELDYLRRDDATAEPVYVLTLEAPDPTAELAQTLIPQDWISDGKNLAANRRAMLHNRLTSTGIIDGLGGAGDFPHYVAKGDYEGSDSLSPVEELFNTTGEFIDYDARTNWIEGSGRYWYTTGDLLKLLVNPAGKAIVAPMADGVGMIPAHKCEMVPATHAQFQAIGRVDNRASQHYTDGTWHEFTSRKNVDGKLWFSNIWARPTIAIIDNDAGGTGSASINETNARSVALAKDAKLFHHPPVTMRHPGGWDYEYDMLYALRCREARAPVYVSGSVFNEIDTDRTPIHRIIGGSVAYREGVWETTRRLAPVPYTHTVNTVTLAQLNPSTTTEVAYADFDDSVTLGDLGRVDKGL